MKYIKILFILPAFFACFHTHAQQLYDSLATAYYSSEAAANGGQLNQTDLQGRKQGMWIQYREYPGYKSWEKGPDMPTETYLREISRGRYLDGKKIGAWLYNRNSSDDHHAPDVEIYMIDGSIQQMIEDGSIQTLFDADSSNVTSNVFIGRDTVCIKCAGRKSCTYSYQGNELFTSGYDRLALEQYRFLNGIYFDKLKAIRKDEDKL
ncbi:MAG: hypothetical protein H6585_07515 [Flavobacteriales bacterium]|nr:hypothetical protein [Flavobacteriales bacterium]MCB9448174.1 hypothetical protein [Flavobacteriales bacterium]